MGLAASGAATAATLSVTVKPTIVHRNQTYAVTITGRYGRQAARQSPHLLAFIQYMGTPCRSTATAEYGLPASEWNWLFWPPQRAETHSPFEHVFYEQARTRYGNRRVCTYLYATRITTQTTAKPIARAGAPYSEVSSRH